MLRCSSSFVFAVIASKDCFLTDNGRLSALFGHSCTHALLPPRVLRPLRAAPPAPAPRGVPPRRPPRLSAGHPGGRQASSKQQRKEKAPSAGLPLPSENQPARAAEGDRSAPSDRLRARGDHPVHRAQPHHPGHLNLLAPALIVKLSLASSLF